MKSVSYKEFSERIKRERKDKVYKLLKDGAGPSHLLSTSSKRNKVLEFFDEDDNMPKTLRYAHNQGTPLQDEQKGQLILGPIEFKDGLLRAPKEQTALQIFIELHPDYGKKFIMLDKEAEAQKQLNSMDLEDRAYDRARELDIDDLERVAKIIFSNKDISKMSSAEIKRDVRVYAKNYPEQFLSVSESPTLSHDAQVKEYFDRGLLSFRNDQTEVFFSLKSNKKRMMKIGPNKEPYSAVSEYLKSDEGLDDMKLLDAEFEALDN